MNGKKKRDEFAIDIIIKHLNISLRLNNHEKLSKDKIKLLKSKKNYVFKAWISEKIKEKIKKLSKINKIGDIIIIKYYNQEIKDYQKRKEREFSIFSLLYNKQINIPKVLLKEEKFILLEYISGRNFEDEYLENKIKNYEFFKLASLVFDFHKNGIRLSDCRLRNFVICNSGDIYRIDFEESSSIFKGNDYKKNERGSKLEKKVEKNYKINNTRKNEIWKNEICKKEIYSTISLDLSALLSAFLDLDNKIFNGELDGQKMSFFLLFLNNYFTEWKNIDGNITIPIIKINFQNIVKFFIKNILTGLKETAARRKIHFTKKNQKKIKRILIDEINTVFNQNNI